jgi:rubrerythrin
VSYPANPPELSIGTIAEALAIAYAMSQEAAQRYGVLAAAFRRLGHGDVAEIFQWLADEERDRVDSVEYRSQHLLHRLPDPANAWGKFPETFTGAGPSALLTPYKALSDAVRHEERAFAFWAYVAAATASEEVRAQAESFARQELTHAAKRAASHPAHAARSSGSCRSCSSAGPACGHSPSAA